MRRATTSNLMSGDSNENADETGLVVHYSFSFRQLCFITVACPLVALVICFVTAYIYQYDDVHETHCRVYNIIPSISAITGVSPQRYLWRASVALHIGPRLIIAAVYRSYQKNSVNDNADSKLRGTAHFWLNTSYWLNILEVTSLGGVTYISNLENYPLHEKLFIVFMVSSLFHMLACMKALKSIGLTNGNKPSMQKELFYKQTLFWVSMLFTVGMILFFLKHRLLCHDMAFSWFAFCEYVVASANMAFHFTGVTNFPTERILVARGATCMAVTNSQNWKTD